MVFGARPLRATLLRLGHPLATSSCCCGAFVAATPADGCCPLLPGGPAELAGPVAYVLALHLLQGLPHKSNGSTTAQRRTGHAAKDKPPKDKDDV
jgi:hypothetical protein